MSEGDREHVSSVLLGATPEQTELVWRMRFESVEVYRSLRFKQG